MKALKKTLSLMLIIALAISILPASFVAYAESGAFSDIGGHWAQSAIEELAAKGIINGMGDGTYAPEGLVTREQFMKLVVSVRDASPNSKTDVFYDVPENAWANSYIAKGLSRGLFSLNEVNGHYFAPESAMDRDTVALWITRAVGISGTSDSTSFADNGSIKNKSAVDIAVAEELVKGYEDNTFRPNNTLTRAESAVLIQRLIAKDTELNSPKEARNEIILKDGVEKFEPSAGVNKLVSSDDETGLYVFENIDDNIRNLQPEQVFTIYPCSSVPEGVAIKVKEIKISGDKAEVWNAGVELSDVVAKLNSAAVSPITLSSIELASVPDGVTVTNGRGQTIAEAKEELSDGILLADVGEFGQPGVGVGFNLESLKLGDFRVSGSLWLEGEVVHDIDYDFWRDGLNPKKIEVYIQKKETIELKVAYKKDDRTGSGSAFHDEGGNRGDIFGDTTSYDWAKSITEDSTKKQKESYDTKIARIAAPIGATGLVVYGDVFIGVSAEGKIFIEVKYEQTQKSGLRYQNGQTTQIKDTDKKVNATLGMEGKIEFGAKFEIGVTFLHIVNVNVNAKGGLGIKGKTDLLSADLSSIFNTGSTEKSFLGDSVKRDKDGNVAELHDCMLCIDGDIYFYLEIGAEIGLVNIPFKGDINFFEANWTIFDENNAKFLDFYVSVRPPALSAPTDSLQAQLGPLALGLTECPHVYKVPEITKQPEGKSVEAGKDVELSVTAKNNSNKNEQINDELSGLSYDWYRDGVKIGGGISMTKLTLPSASADTDGGEYHCVVYLTEHPEVKKQSNRVTVIVTAPAPPQIDFEASDKPIPTMPSDSGSGGDFEVETPDFSPQPIPTHTPTPPPNDGFDVIIPEF